nr:MAG TPA: hypothetical protein [Caudoviricetes sp.]
MAELKWTNVNDSGANAAFSNYLEANKSFRKSIMGIGDTLSDFTQTLKQGDAENTQRIRDEVTNSILNRANGIQSQEDMDKYLASGALDNDPLRQQYGWFVNMDKINETKANLPKDVLSRATDTDASKAYNQEARQLQMQLNDAISRRDNATAQKIQSRLNQITSLASSSANANNLSQLTKDIDDRDLKAIEWEAKSNEAINNASIASMQADQNLQSIYTTIAPLLTDANGNSLLYNEDGSAKPITLDLINQSALDSTAKAQYSAQLVQAEQAAMQARAGFTQAQAFSNNVRQHFGKEVIQPQVSESNAQAILNRIQGSNGSSTPPSNSILARANSVQSNQVKSTEPEKQLTPSELYSQEGKKPVEEMTGRELTQTGLNIKAKQRIQQEQSKVNNETSNGRLNGVNKAVAMVRSWNDSNRPASYEAFRAGLKGEDLKAFDQANARTGGKLTEYVQASISGADTSAWDNAFKEYEYYSDIAKNNEAMSYVTAKLGGNTDPATASYLASAISAPKQITEKIDGKDITLTSDTSEHSKTANKANLDKMLASWYAKQGWIDGSDPSRWTPDLDMFRDKVNGLISKGVDPIAIYSVIKEMDSKANGGEVDAKEFRDVLNVLDKEKDNLSSWKDDFHTKNKNLIDLKNNETNKLLFASQAVPETKLGSLSKDKALAIFDNLNSGIRGHLGDASQTEAQKQETDVLVQQLQNWANGITPTDTQKLSQAVKNNTYGYGFGVAKDYTAEAVNKRAKQTEKRLDKVRNQPLPKEQREAIIRLFEIGSPSQIKKISELFGIKG